MISVSNSTGLSDQIKDVLRMKRWFKDLHPAIQNDVIEAIETVVIRLAEHEVKPTSRVATHVFQDLWHSRVRCVLSYCNQELQSLKAQQNNQSVTSESIGRHLVSSLAQPDVIRKVLERQFRLVFEARSVYPAGRALRFFINNLTQPQITRCLELLRMIESYIFAHHGERVIEYLNGGLGDRYWGFLHPTYRVFSSILLDYLLRQSALPYYEIALDHIAHVLNSNDPEVKGYLEETVSKQFKLMEAFNLMGSEALTGDMVLEMLANIPRK